MRLTSLWIPRSEDYNVTYTACFRVRLYCNVNSTPAFLLCSRSNRMHTQHRVFVRTHISKHVSKISYFEIVSLSCCISSCQVERLDKNHKNVVHRVRCTEERDWQLQQPISEYNRAL